LVQNEMRPGISNDLLSIEIRLNNPARRTRKSRMRMFQQSIVCHDYSTLSKVFLANCRQTLDEGCSSSYCRYTFCLGPSRENLSSSWGLPEKQHSCPLKPSLSSADADMPLLGYSLVTSGNTPLSTQIKKQIAVKAAL
jgi:hypothetical protein